MVRTTTDADARTETESTDADIWSTANETDRRLFRDGGDSGVDMTKTGYTFKHPDTCSLYTSGHAIATRFADVLHAFEDAFDDHTNATVTAGGCNGCTTVDDDVDVWAYYVAQGTDDVDSLYVGYGAADDAAIGSKLVAYTLVGIAKEHGVPVSWNGDTSKKVCLGDANAYDDE